MHGGKTLTEKKKSIFPSKKIKLMLAFGNMTWYNTLVCEWAVLCHCRYYGTAALLVGMNV